MATRPAREFKAGDLVRLAGVVCRIDNVELRHEWTFGSALPEAARLVITTTTAYGTPHTIETDPLDPLELA